MRVIGGSRRGAILKSRNTYETRPTSGKVRESLFNILRGGNYGKCVEGANFIDLFAGTGAVGLEALSQGAKFASFIEIDKEIAKTIQKNVFKLKFQTESSIINSDAMILDYWREEPADIIFADPPYNSGNGVLAIANLKRIGALSKRSVVVLETDKNEIIDLSVMDSASLKLAEQRTYGRALLRFFKSSL